VAICFQNSKYKHWTEKKKWTEERRKYLLFHCQSVCQCGSDLWSHQCL